MFFAHCNQTETVVFEHAEISKVVEHSLDSISQGMCDSVNVYENIASGYVFVTHLDFSDIEKLHGFVAPELSQQLAFNI